MSLRSQHELYRACNEGDRHKMAIAHPHRGNRFRPALGLALTFLLGPAMIWPGASVSSWANAQGKDNGAKKDGISPPGKTGKASPDKLGLDRGKTVVVTKPKGAGNGPKAKEHFPPVAATGHFSKVDKQHLETLLGPDSPIRLTAAQGSAVKVLSFHRSLTQNQRNSLYEMLDSRAPGMTLARRLAIGRGLREDIDRKARMHSQGDTEPLARLLDPGSPVKLAQEQRLAVKRLLAGSLLTRRQRQILFAMLRHREPWLSAGQRLCIVRCMSDDTVRCAGIAEYCSSDGTGSAEPDGAGKSPDGGTGPKGEDAGAGTQGGVGADGGDDARDGQGTSGGGDKNPPDDGGTTPGGDKNPPDDGGTTPGGDAGTGLKAKSGPTKGGAAAKRQTRRHLLVENATREKLTVFVQYYTHGDKGQWGWVPANPAQKDAKALTLALEPGETTNVADKNGPISASRVRLWATSAGGAAWAEYRDKDLWLMAEPVKQGQRSYVGAEMDTFTFTFSPE
jgi:hypothetical protein